MRTGRGLVALVSALFMLGTITAEGAASTRAEPDYEPTPESLRSHPIPRWFTDAKLGYFIHPGAYSVPAFASKPDGKSYAEWYWYEYNQVGSHTFERHRDKYGANHPRREEGWSYMRHPTLNSIP